jgi:Ala-tRNA(Pro) deacylase
MPASPHRAEAGDIVVISGHRIGEHEHTGEILEVIDWPPHERYRVRWDDERESLFYPGSDATIRHSVRPRTSTEEEVATTRAAEHELVEALERASVTYELIRHPPTTSARAEARVLGLDPSEVAKTVVLTAAGGFVRAVLPASEHLDLEKVRTHLGTTAVRLATEAVLAGAYPDFELGAVPPLSGGEGDRVLIDRRLCERELVVLEAGTHELSVRLRTTDLVKVSNGELVDLCES